VKQPLKRFTPDGYAFRWVDECIDISLEEVHEARGGELRALMTVQAERDGRVQLLFQADFNIASAQSRQTAARSLATRISPEEIDWTGMLEIVCYHAREHWREGDPPVYLPEHQPDRRRRFLVPPFIEYGGPTILFAMGGTGKSLFALALALTVAAGVDIGLGQPQDRLGVAYLDWETDADTHFERLSALCAGRDLPLPEAHLWHYRQTASLAASAPHLRRRFAKDCVGLMVIDSLGAARGGEPESADSTIRLFNAARSIGVPWIGVDHMTKNGGTEQGTPFGSVFTHNLARATWALEVVEPLQAGTQTIALTNRKANNGPLAKRHAFNVDFRSTSDALELVRYNPVDAMGIPAMLQKLPIVDQVAALLREWGPLTVAEMCDRGDAMGYGLKPPAVSMALSRNPRRFAVKTQSFPAVWALLSQYEEAR
jgi:hypothetical protein